MTLVLFVMLINLRGVKESGAAFAIPTYFFVVMMFVTVGFGFFRYLTGTLGTVPNPPPMEVHGELQAMSAFLLLHAFSSGTAALTGIEAISNGITAFREPRSRNAGITLIWMAAILGTLFLGISFLARQIARRALRAGDGHLAARPDGVRRAGLSLSGSDRRHHGDPDHGGQHILCRLPAPERAAWPPTAFCPGS